MDEMHVTTEDLSAAHAVLKGVDYKGDYGPIKDAIAVMRAVARAEASVSQAIASARAAGRRELVEAFKKCSHANADVIDSEHVRHKRCRACGATNQTAQFCESEWWLKWSAWTLPGLLDGEAGR
jgi:hypothetical protein